MLINRSLHGPFFSPSSNQTVGGISDGVCNIKDTRASDSQTIRDVIIILSFSFFPLQIPWRTPGRANMSSIRHQPLGPAAPGDSDVEFSDNESSPLTREEIYGGRYGVKGAGPQHKLRSAVAVGMVASWIRAICTVRVRVCVCCHIHTHNRFCVYTELSVCVRVYVGLVYTIVAWTSRTRHSHSHISPRRRRVRGHRARARTSRAPTVSHKLSRPVYIWCEQRTRCSQLTANRACDTHARAHTHTHK